MAVARREGNYDRVTWKDISDGTKLRVHSKEWFDENCSKANSEWGGYYSVVCTLRSGIRMDVKFTGDMLDYISKVVTVKMILDTYMIIEESNSNYCWYPEMFESVVD